MTRFKITGTDEYSLKIAFDWSANPQYMSQDAYIYVVKTCQPSALPISTLFYNREPFSRSYYPTNQLLELDYHISTHQKWSVFDITWKRALTINSATFDDNKIFITVTVYEDISADRSNPEYQFSKRHKITFDVLTKTSSFTTEKDTEN